MVPEWKEMKQEPHNEQTEQSTYSSKENVLNTMAVTTKKNDKTNAPGLIQLLFGLFEFQSFSFLTIVPFICFQVFSNEKQPKYKLGSTIKPRAPENPSTKRVFQVLAHSSGVH